MGAAVVLSSRCSSRCLLDALGWQTWTRIWCLGGWCPVEEIGTGGDES